MMKLLVPEFKSRNSVFEQIDREIEQETLVPEEEHSTITE